MKKVIYFIPIFLGIVLSIGVLAMHSSQISSQDIGVNQIYSSNVCLSVNKADGSHEDLGCYTDSLTDAGVQEMLKLHNVLTNAGAEAIEDILGQNTAFGAFNYIGLCNATAGCTTPSVTDTTIDNEYTTAGLTRAVGTYYDNANGNWTISKTFTATADSLETNVTGLYNQATGGTLLATNSFTLATLQTNDQLTVNITITAS